MMIFSSKTHTLDTGKYAEKIAEQYLRKHGLTLLKRNFYSRFGEIDLIMKDATNTLVFIEVRSRRAHAQVSALESISAQKIHKIRKTAQFYLLQFDTQPNCRFDVIAMTHNRDYSRYTIDWIADAF